MLASGSRSNLLSRSGAVVIKSLTAAHNSDDVLLRTGSAPAGSSKDITIKTGTSEAKAGSLSIAVGQSNAVHNDTVTPRLGGDLFLQAGNIT
eukprot:14096032-Ditylum_brightwellii.AAC.1